MSAAATARLRRRKLAGPQTGHGKPVKRSSKLNVRMGRALNDGPSGFGSVPLAAQLK